MAYVNFCPMVLNECLKFSVFSTLNQAQIFVVTNLKKIFVVTIIFFKFAEMFKTTVRNDLIKQDDHE